MKERKRARPQVRRLFLTEWREAAGLTQAQLAERLGTTSQTVSRWETGARLMSVEAQAAIAEQLGIRPLDLYRHPREPSLDALLDGHDTETREHVARIVSELLIALKHR